METLFECLRRWKMMPRRQKFKRDFLILCLCLLILSVWQPARNIFLGRMFPGPWTYYSTAFGIKVLLDIQNFPVDDVARTPVEVNISADFETFRRKFLQSGAGNHPRYFSHISKLRSVAASDQGSSKELKTMLKFYPIMSPEDNALIMFTLDVFMRACDAANLTFFLIDGSLLGSARHGGMVPWDDDIDVVLDADQWVKIRDVLSNVKGFELFSPAGSQWKFYMKSLPKQKGKPFSWPNLDVFFFRKNKERIWGVTWTTKAILINDLSDVFPLVRRPFGYLKNVPHPRRYVEMAYRSFGDFFSACYTPNYNHKTNDRFSWTAEGIQCSFLHDVYPFITSSSSASLPREHRQT